MHKVWIIAALSAAQQVAAFDAGPARASLERFNAGLERLQAGFRQQVISAEGELLETGEGRVWISRPNRFRWQYSGEFPELIVADGERIWMYDETLEQVTVKPQSGLAEDTPLMLLTDLSGLDRQFNVTELGEIEGVQLLELAVKSREAEFDRVLLGLEGDRLALMVLEDAFGIRTEIRFDDLTRNPDLEQGLFRFEPPPGVDVVGEAALP